MKQINLYITEKLHLNQDINIENKTLSLSNWITYIKELGGIVSTFNKKFYTITLKEYKSDYSPELSIYVEQSKPTPKYWRACMPQSSTTYYTKDIEVIVSKKGDDFEYYIKKDELDSCSNGWLLTQDNAKVIINNLKEFDNE